MGGVFSSVDREQEAIARTIRAEEESFSKTLDRGLLLFDEIVSTAANSPEKAISGADAFKLYDTYGFPLDLTQLMARERGLGLDEAGFEALMAEQRSRSQAAQKREIISVEAAGLDLPPTAFLGYDTLETVAKVLHVDGAAVVVDQSPFYAEMGGQVGDAGELYLGDRPVAVEGTTKIGEGIFLHKLALGDAAQPVEGLEVGTSVGLRVDPVRRYRISAHHSATHLLHWALREVLGDGVAQKGSLVTPDRFRFDFSHPQPVTDEQLMEIQRKIVEKVEADAAILTEERPYAEVKGDPSILQFFSDKYGETVRVVSIGDYSKELCGGTHVQSTSQIGFVKVIMESGIAAGVRRIEAVAGWALTDHVRHELPKQDERWQALRLKKADIEPLAEYVEEEVPRANWHQLLNRQQQLAILDREVRQWEKEAAANFTARLQSEAAETAQALLQKVTERNAVQTIIEDCGERHPDFLVHLVDALKKDWQGVAVLASQSQGRVTLAVSVADALKGALNASSILQEIAPIVNGKGGGKPGFARGSGENPEKIPQALQRAAQLF